MKFGFVGVVGRPNVGKSTLVNALTGHDIAIVSPVAQTTRSAIRGLVNSDAGQMVLVDTPGIHKPVTLLGKRLNDLATRTLGEVDVVCFVVDGASGIGRGDEMLAGWLPDDKPCVAVVNKTDAMSGAAIAEQLAAASGLRDFDAFVPVSAIERDGVTIVEDELYNLLDDGDPLFPPDMPTDQTERHLIAEFVREQLLLRTRDEVPHSIAVMVDDIEGLEDPESILRVTCLIYVERKSQKGIVIGKSGGVLKVVGQNARERAEALLGRHIYLSLRVKVSPDWQRRASSLNRLGY